jgi:hypothetical protein
VIPLCTGSQTMCLSSQLAGLGVSRLSLHTAYSCDSSFSKVAGSGLDSSVSVLN